MMGAESLFGNLSHREKTAIMAVLSRDRQLRETEEERVMKLRIDLARERRHGVLVAGKGNPGKKRNCARCREKIGILEAARCPVCKHVICKKCRVPRSLRPLGSHEPMRLIAEDRATLASPIRLHQEITRTDSNCSYPTELNPFEVNENDDHLEDIPTSTPQKFISGVKIPTFKYDVIEDVSVTSTPYDPRLGRSLVGGDVGAMTSPAKLNIHHRNNIESSSSHISFPRRFPNLGSSSAYGVSSHKSDHVRDQLLLMTRQRFYDQESSDPSFQTSTSLNISRNIKGSSPGLSRSTMTPYDNDDSRNVVSDSSAHITPTASPSQSIILGEHRLSPMSKKSNSTGFLPDFDEKEAVEFLMQIGAKYEKPVSPTPSPEHRSETIEEDQNVSITGLKEQKSDCIAKRVDNGKEQHILNSDSNRDNVPSENKIRPREDDPKRSGALSFFTDAVETITKELRAAKMPNLASAQFESKTTSGESNKPRLSFSLNMFSTATKKDGSKVSQNPFGFLTANTSSKSPKIDVMSKFKDILLLNPPAKTNQGVGSKGDAAKLFQMASNPNANDAKCQTTKLVGHVPACAVSENENASDQSKSGNCEQRIPFDAADGTNTTVVDAESVELQVENRLCQSNPNSPYRTKRKLFSISTDEAGGCMSETSVTSDSGKIRKMVSSSSDAPSTTSSDEYHDYHYARRKARTSSRMSSLKYDGIVRNTTIKDSGYSTHENHLKARSRYMRATRLSRRARERERDLRRLGKRSLAKPRMITLSSIKRKESSSDLSDVRKDTGVTNSEIQDSSLETKSANTNIMPRKDDYIDTAASEPITSLPIESSQNSLVGPTVKPRRKSSTAAILFQQIKNKVVPLSNDSNWVCRVCDKALDVKKKSGDWFHSSARPEVFHFKELLLNTERRMSADTTLLLTCKAGQEQRQPSPLATFDNDASSQRAETAMLHPPLRRLRSNTLPCDMNTAAELSQPGTLGSSPSLASLNNLSVDLSQLEASLQRQRLRMGKKSVAEVLHGELLLHVPDPRANKAPPPFKKKQSSVSQSLVPACITDGPRDVTILRGNPISLCCALGGTPPLKSVWRKGKNEIKSSSQCTLDLTNKSASLTIRSSARDDSGCYTLQVKNSYGVDQYSINVSVVAVPDPPGQPYASDISGNTLVVSWYGTGYDGGSTITGYRVEMADVTTSTRSPKWSSAASARSTSCTVKDLKPNSKYIFRVCAENKYGISSPGPASDIVLNTMTEVAESSEDEEENFVKHDHVILKTDGSFSNRYETKERLGQGRFGKVHRVVCRNSGKEYAAKIMRALKAKDREAVQQEIDIMNSLRHPRLVQLVDAYSHGREVTMVMDLVSGGELFERVIDEDFELTEAACIKYMSQICEGLKYMHDALILHLDLKPENIMCINKTGTQVKIIDFGLARKFNPRETIRVMFGTPEFVAPEVINYDAIGPETDMWSVGVICYILLSGLSPFMGDNDAETLSNITAAEWDFEDEAFDEISYEAKDFIRHLLVKSRGKRFTVDKALAHKWLKKDTEKMSKSKLNTKNLKRFLARRKWQKTGNAVRALGRLASLANLGSSNSNPNKISNGQPRESGFLAALKAQLLRENEEEQDYPSYCKPMFETLFDDVEVIEGSAAKFECTIIGTPDPEIMWYKDGEPIKESRHFRISYTEDDVCALLISDATEADEAEYTCKAVNHEGETEHRAELIVITPGV